MRILIIEDLQHKIDELSKFLIEVLDHPEIVIRKSYQSGLEEVLEHHDEYDLLLLDMSMQNYDIAKNESGGDPINLAGLHILEHMYSKEINNKVIVVTMYGNFGEENYSLIELHERLSRDFPDIYQGHVFFSASENEWKDKLHLLITKSIN